MVRYSLKLSTRHWIACVSLLAGASLGGCSDGEQGRSSTLVANGSEDSNMEDAGLSPQGSGEEVTPPVNVVGAYLVEPKIHRCFHETREDDETFRAMCGVSLTATEQSEADARSAESIADGPLSTERIQFIFSGEFVRSLLVTASSPEEAIELAQLNFQARSVEFEAERGRGLSASKQKTYRHSSGKAVIYARTSEGSSKWRGDLESVQVNLGFEPVRERADTSLAKVFENPADALLHRLLDELGLSILERDDATMLERGLSELDLPLGLPLATEKLLEASMIQILEAGLGELDKLFSDEGLKNSKAPALGTVAEKTGKSFKDLLPTAGDPDPAAASLLDDGSDGSPMAKGTSDVLNNPSGSTDGSEALTLRDLAKLQGSLIGQSDPDAQ